MKNIFLDDEAQAEEGTCVHCGAYGLTAGEPCDCLDEDNDSFETMGYVPLAEVPPLSREEFYEMLHDDPEYEAPVDPDDLEMRLIATVVTLDNQVQELKKKLAA